MQKKEIGKGKFLAAVVLCIALVAACTGCGKSWTVTVQDGNSSTGITVSGSKTTVEDALTEAQITLNDGDEVSPAADTVLTEDDTLITIARHVTVHVSDGEVDADVELTGATVQDAIDEAGITLEENDEVNYDLTVYLTDGMEITVTHRNNITKTVVTEEVEIAYETVTEDSDELLVGETEVKQEGVNGIQKNTYEVTYSDDEEVSRELISEEVVQEPVDEIILSGTKEDEPSAQSDTEEYSEDGRKIVSKEAVYDCDGSGNGYYVIEYEDGTTEYEDFYDPDFW